MRALIFICLLIWVHSFCRAQTDTMRLHGLPVEGYCHCSEPKPVKKVHFCLPSKDIPLYAANEHVFAIAPGTVVAVLYMPGIAYTVMIKHNNAYAVYSDLDTVYVKKDQQVYAGQELGKIAYHEERSGYVCNFQLWTVSGQKAVPYNTTAVCTYLAALRCAQPNECPEPPAARQ